MYVCYMLYKADSARACAPAHTQVEAKENSKRINSDFCHDSSSCLKV